MRSIDGESVCMPAFQVRGTDRLSKVELKASCPNRVKNSLGLTEQEGCGPGEPCQARLATARTAKDSGACGLQGLSSSSTSALVGDRLTVGQRTLTPPVLVRIQVPQPLSFSYKRSELEKLVSPRRRGPSAKSPATATMRRKLQPLAGYTDHGPSRSVRSHWSSWVAP